MSLPEIPLPEFLPYFEVMYFLIIAGVGSVVVTSIGAMLRAWSWKVPQTLGMAFIGVGLMFIVALWLFDRLFNQ